MGALNYGLIVDEMMSQKKQINFLKNKTFSLVGSWVEHIDEKNKSFKLLKYIKNSCINCWRLWKF